MRESSNTKLDTSRTVLTTKWGNKPTNFALSNLTAMESKDLRISKILTKTKAENLLSTGKEKSVKPSLSAH